MYYTLAYVSHCMVEQLRKLYGDHFTNVEMYMSGRSLCLIAFVTIVATENVFGGSLLNFID